MSDHYEGVLLEQIRDDVQRLAEAMSGLGSTVTCIDKRLERVEGHTVDIPGIRAAITDQSKQLQNHENQIIALES